MVVLAVAALAGTALSASADTGTGGVPIVVAGSPGGQIHHCAVVGKPAKGYQAVICADISTSPVLLAKTAGNSVGEIDPLWQALCY